MYRSVDDLLHVVTSKPDMQVGRETREFIEALNGELERQAAVRRELRRAREEKTTLAETVKAVHPEKKNEAEGRDEGEGESKRWRDKIAKKVEAKKEEIK